MLHTLCFGFSFSECVLHRSHCHGLGNGFFLPFRAAKLTEHEGNHKAPNGLLIPADSVANHYTSSSHVFSTFYSSFLTPSTPDPPHLSHLWPRSLASPCGCFFCVKMTVFVCVCVCLGDKITVREKRGECVCRCVLWELPCTPFKSAELSQKASLLSLFAVSESHTVAARRSRTAKCQSLAVKMCNSVSRNAPFGHRSRRRLTR